MPTLTRPSCSGIIPHHQGAVDMAEIVLKFGNDARNRHFAREIVNTPEA
jgi:uncharacterized protein (DUF305 family)